MAKRAKRKRTRRYAERRTADLEAQIEQLRAASKGRGKFSARAVQQDRQRLELTLADYAKLASVSRNTIYTWEHHRSRPRGAQLEKWLAINGMPKAAAWKKLGIIATLKARLAGEGAKFSARAVHKDRERLGLALAEYARLVGVTMNTIWVWEHGHGSRPRAAQLERWLAVKGMTKEAAWKKLGIEEVPEFHGKAVKAERKRLGLSAAKYAKLVGVSMLTIYDWEKGRSVPRESALEKWLAVKGIGKAKALGRLGIG